MGYFSSFLTGGQCRPDAQQGTLFWSSDRQERSAGFLYSYGITFQLWHSRGPGEQEDLFLKISSEGI